MNVSQYEALIKALETGTLTQAAEALGYTQSGLTRFLESDDHAVIAMVEQGLGVSLMSQMMLLGFSRKIAAIPLDPPAWRDLGIGCKDRRSLSAAAAAFVQCAKDWLREEGYFSA